MEQLHVPFRKIFIVNINRSCFKFNRRMRQMRKMDVSDKEEMKESLIWKSKVSDWTINKLLLWKTGIAGI